MCAGFFFISPPPIMLSTNPLSVVLAAGFAEDSESHTDISRGEQDPEEVFSCLLWSEEPSWQRLQEFKQFFTAVASSYASCQGHQSDIICRKRKGLLAASSKGTLFLHLLLFSFFPPTFSLCSAFAIEFCFTRAICKPGRTGGSCRVPGGLCPFLVSSQQSAAQQMDFTKLPSQSRAGAYLAPSACDQSACACPACSTWRGAAVTCTGSWGLGGRRLRWARAPPGSCPPSRNLGFGTVYFYLNRFSRTSHVQARRCYGGCPLAG